MKAMKPKTVLLFLVLMGCVPSIGFAQSLQEAIDESLIVPLAALEAQVYYNTTPEVKAAKEKYDAASIAKWPNLFKYEGSMKYVGPHDPRQFSLDPAIRNEYEAERRAIDEKWTAASDEYFAAQDKARADVAAAVANATAKARQGKKRARHCRATLKPVDDHLEIVEIVECVQTMEAIADMCGTATNQFRMDKNLNASIDTEMHTLKAHVTQCVTDNITGYSALMVYEVKREDKDQYAGLIEKCRQEETNTLGVLGYEFMWPCFKGYLDMLDEPLEPPPTEISPEPKEDSETLPKVKA